MTNEKSDFTQGSILKKLVAFMIPVLGALILQAAYGAVDLLVVGRFGSTSGLSAVSTGSQVLNLVTFVVTQTAMGITVLIARYLGEKKPEQIGAVIGGAAVVFTIISVVLFVVMVGFARPISISDAGTDGGCGSDYYLCTYLWSRNFLHCSLQLAVCNFQRTWRQ